MILVYMVDYTLGSERASKQWMQDVIWLLLPEKKHSLPYEDRLCLVNTF